MSSTGERERTGRDRKSVSWAVVMTLLVVTVLMMLGAIYLVVRSGKV